MLDYFHITSFARAVYIACCILMYLCVKYSMEPFLAKTPTGLRVETTKPFLVSLMDAFSTRGYILPWKGAQALNTLCCKETLQYTVNTVQSEDKRNVSHTIVAVS